MGKVIPLLQKKGFNVTAVQLPLTSLSDDIAATRNLLSMQTRPSPTRDLQVRLEYSNGPAMRKSSSAHQVPCADARRVSSSCRSCTVSRPLPIT
jgi:hypothetical protein